MNVSLVSRRIGIHALDPRVRPYARISAVILLLSLLGGCTSAPKLPTPPAPPTSPTQDIRDGVPVNPGIDIEKIPDAVVRAEPRSPYGNPVSYEIGSQRYYPLEDATGFVESGIASWYGSKFHGRRTSSGEIYDAWKMTAAHKTLPLPTYVSVQDIESGKKVVVKVNDRGPFYPDRIIDLSYAAAAKLGIAKKGTGLVEIRALTPKEDPPLNRPSDEKATVSASAKPRSMVPAAVSKPAAAPKPAAASASASIAASVSSSAKIAAKSVPKSAPSPSPPAVIQKEALPLPSPLASASASTPASTPVLASASTSAPASASTSTPTPSSKPIASTPSTTSTTQFTAARSAAKPEADSGSSLKKAIEGVFLQIASFRRQANAARLRDRLLSMAVESVHTKEFRHRGQRYYRVRVGPLPSRQSAKEVAGSLRSLGLGEPLIVSE